MPQRMSGRLVFLNDLEVARTQRRDGFTQSDSAASNYFIFCVHLLDKIVTAQPLS